jgi:hypothetical protein
MEHKYFSWKLVLFRNVYWNVFISVVVTKKYNTMQLVQPIAEAWPLLQFLNPIQIR